MQGLFGVRIAVYSRQQAIEDGVLADVTETAREVGFRIPVTFTAAVWAACNSKHPSDENS
jgi:hypothetical protein